MSLNIDHFSYNDTKASDDKDYLVNLYFSPSRPRPSVLRDTRGWGRYNIFPVDNGQINVSVTYPGIIRAFHRHLQQDDYWYVIDGDFEICLAYPDGKVEKQYISGPASDCLKIPVGVWHGFKVLGTKPGVLLYYVTNKYDPQNPDEERAEWNKFYGWEQEYK